MEVVVMDSEHGQRFAEPGGHAERAAVSFVPPDDPRPSAAPAQPPPLPQRPPSPLAAVLERSRKRLFEIEGVHGVAEGRTPAGDDAVRVDVDSEIVGRRIPNEIEGYPVEVVIVPGGFGTLPAGAPYTG
jgi:hypothetical protein